jgi:ketosteroid isomerase-like protein
MRCTKRALRRAALPGVLLLAACTTALRVGDPELASAERAFARLAGEIGTRDAFVASFADDGLVFEPAPVRVRDAWPLRPRTPGPEPRRLSWQPELVVAAASGDLGLSTGPFRVEERASGATVAQGAFFSIWTREPGGAWRVWLDMGASMTQPVEPSTWRVIPRPARGGAPAALTAAAVMARDAALSGMAPATFAAALAVDARQHRDARVPTFAREWIADLERDAGIATYTPVEARVARSGDFAAVHGRVVRRANGLDAASRYVHVWLRDGGQWQLAVETLIDDR